MTGMRTRKSSTPSSHDHATPAQSVPSLTMRNKQTKNMGPLPTRSRALHEAGPPPSALVLRQPASSPSPQLMIDDPRCDSTPARESTSLTHLTFHPQNLLPPFSSFLNKQRVLFIFDDGRPRMKMGCRLETLICAKRGATKAV